MILDKHPLLKFSVTECILFVSDDVEKLEEQKKWLDSEVEKVVEQRRQVEELAEVRDGALRVEEWQR
jgi:hypothetical protein